MDIILNNIWTFINSACGFTVTWVAAIMLVFCFLNRLNPFRKAWEKYEGEGLSTAAVSLKKRVDSKHLSIKRIRQRKKCGGLIFCLCRRCLPGKIKRASCLIFGGNGSRTLEGSSMQANQLIRKPAAICAVIVTFAASSSLMGWPLTEFVSPTDDAHVRNDTPDTNYGETHDLLTWTGYTGGQRGRSYLKFSMDDMPAYGDVISITLNLYMYDRSGFVHTVNIHHVADDSWTENTITWNNKPAFSTTILDTVTTTEIGWQEYELFSGGSWDYAADLDDGFLSLLVKSTEGGDEWRRYYSKEATEGDGVYAPYLRVIYIPEPASLGVLSLVAMMMFACRGRRA